MTSPCFVPDDVMVHALQAAAMRGVDIQILLPGKADHRLVELASFTYYSEMMACCLRLFRYQNQFLHQKVVLVNDRLAGVGTVNLDNRALYLNFEATALVADDRFANRETKCRGRVLYIKHDGQLHKSFESLKKLPSQKV